MSNTVRVKKSSSKWFSEVAYLHEKKSKLMVKNYSVSSLETTIFRQNRQFFRRTFPSWSCLTPNFYTLMRGNRGTVTPIRGRKKMWGQTRGCKFSLKGISYGLFKNDSVTKIEVLTLNW